MMKNMILLKLLYIFRFNKCFFQRERIGIVEARWKPALEIEGIAGRIRETWRMRCENPPKVKLNGHTEAQFPYIPLGVDYILQEIFKNSFRLKDKT